MNDLFETNVNPEPTQLDRIEAMLIQLLAKKKPVKARAVKEEYSAAFEMTWDEYPKRAGSNPKNKAWSAFHKRFHEESVWQTILWGTERYAKYCKATGKTGTEYVMQAATFFGPERHYENDWTIPASVTKAKVPKDNDEMLTWAVKRGMRQPHQGESWNQYRAYVAGEA